MAHLIAFARDHEATVYDLSFSRKGYAKHFAFSRNQLVVRYPDFLRVPFNAVPIQNGIWKLFRTLQRRKLVTNPRLLGGSFDQHILQELKSPQIEFEGVDFVYKNGVKHHANFIREYMRFNDSIQDKTSRFINRLRDSCEVVVGVHVRRRDFKHFDSGKHYYSWASYANYAKRISKLLPNKKVTFAICTDSPGEYSSVYFGKLKTALSGFSAAEDMSVLSKCDLIIAPGRSTFSGWASFVGQVPRLCMSKSANECCLEDFSTVRSLIN